MRNASPFTRLAVLLLLAFPLTRLAAQQPAGAVIRARSDGATEIARLPVDQVRAIIAAHLPAVASGASDDNLVTLVFDANGEFVTGGSAKVEGALIGRAGGATAGTIVRATGVGPSFARTPAPGGDSVVTTGVAITRVRSTDTPPPLMQADGIGTIDPRLIHEMYIAPYEAGQISTNAVRLRVIRLSGSSIK